MANTGQVPSNGISVIGLMEKNTHHSSHTGHLAAYPAPNPRSGSGVFLPACERHSQGIISRNSFDFVLVCSSWL